MAQADYTIDNASGATVRADINSTLSAIVSLNSGAAEPSTTFANMLWVDETNDLMKIRNAANSGWVTIASWDGTTWVPYSNGLAVGYGEGTFTPTLEGTSVAGTHTYANQVGSYISIGNLVWFSLRMTLTAKGGTMSGDVIINGLPLASSNTGGQVVAMAVAYSNIDLSAGKSQVICTLSQNSQAMSLLESGDNVGAVALTTAAIASNTTLEVSGVYRTG